jgi:hypothetical protein
VVRAWSAEPCKIGVWEWIACSCQYLKQRLFRCPCRTQGCHKCSGGAGSGVGQRQPEQQQADSSCKEQGFGGSSMPSWWLQVPSWIGPTRLSERCLSEWGTRCDLGEWEEDVETHCSPAASSRFSPKTHARQCPRVCSLLSPCLALQEHSADTC